MSASDFKTRQQIAELYPIPYSTLKKLSMQGEVGGPPIIRIGKAVYYHVPSFEEWLKSYLTLPGEEAKKQASRSKGGRRGRPTKAALIERRRNAAMESALTALGETGDGPHASPAPAACRS